MHDRKYNPSSNEYEMRRGIYASRVQEVKHHNSNPSRRWTAVVNHLTDQTETELKRLRGYKLMATSKKTAAGSRLNQVDSALVPDTVSWAHLNAVRQDVNQEACGSCWALATVIMLQANAEVHGRGRTFSPQELVDCVPNPHNCGGSGGCDGATVELGMNWVAANGLDSWQGTPYMAQDGTCRKMKDPALVEAFSQKLDEMTAIGFHPTWQGSGGALMGLQGWERLPENDYIPLLTAVATRGPVAVSVGADKWGMYGGGIFDSCSPNAIVDHAVTLIGYGRDIYTNEKFWHIKNSWSNRWGETGFIRLLRHEGNMHCGIDDKPKDGTGCDGGPPSVKVCGMCGILYDSVVPYM